MNVPGSRGEPFLKLAEGDLASEIPSQMLTNLTVKRGLHDQAASFSLGKY